MAQSGIRVAKEEPPIDRDFDALPEYEDSTAEEIHALIEMKKMILSPLKSVQSTVASNSEFSTHPAPGRAHARGRHEAARLFATSFNEYALLHQHVTDKLIYKYPLIQYKMLQGSPLVLSINEGAEVLMEIYDKFDEIKLGESKYSIMERGVTLRNEEFGCSEDIHSYRFTSPWLVLSQENYPKYRDASWEERADLLRRILVGNILSASKGLGYVAKEHIRLDVGRMQDEICLLKGMKVTGIRGEFTASFAIPDYMGLGKSVSRGYGAVTRLKSQENKN